MRKNAEGYMPAKKEEEKKKKLKINSEDFIIK